MIACIDDDLVIKKILKSAAGGWEVKRKPPPRANSPPIETFIIYDELPAPSADAYLTDPQYPIETYL